MTMTDESVIRLILNEQWPEETSLVGESTLEQITTIGQGESEVAPYVPEGGHAFDMLATVELLTATAILTQQLIVLYRLMRTDGKTPSPDDLVKELDKANRSKTSNIDEVLVRLPAIAESVVRLLKSISSS
jgi:hypothetical protein